MMVIVKETHRDANTREVVDRLWHNFPSTKELSPDRLYEWQEEFAARPASACIRGLDVLQQEQGFGPPSVQSFNAIMARGFETKPQSVAERTREYIALSNAGGPEAIASRQRTLDWCRARKAENPGAFAKLHEAAVNDWGVINPATRKKWLDADPCESLAVASLVRAHCER